MAKKFNQERVLACMSALIKLHSVGDTISWADFKESVRMDVPDGGWLRARGCLQTFINAGDIKRTSNLHVEEYAVS